MTKKQIYKKCIELIQSDTVRYICQALDSVACEECSEKAKNKVLKLKYHFSNAENIPEEFRGEKWCGTPVAGLWLPDANKERVGYLKYLISKL